MNLRRLLMCAIAVWSFPACWAASVEDCTQAALKAAIAADHEVLFDEPCAITFTNQITITRDTTIDGNGYDVSFNGAGNTRLFLVRSGATLTLSGLRLAGGKSSIGGAIYVYGGGSAVITNCWFEGNHAVGDDGLDGKDGANRTNAGGDGGNGTDGSEALGGAIHSIGSLRLLVCQFLTNSATGGNGGKGGAGGSGAFQAGNGGDAGSGGGAFGGAVYCAGPLFLQDCLFEGNACQAGNGALGGDAGSGAFYGLPGKSGKGAEGAGGGVFAGGGATVLSSTFFANDVSGGDSAESGTSPGGSGRNGPDGGLASGGGFWGSSAGVTNCTFSGNKVLGGNGGHGGPGVFTSGDGGNGGDGQGGALALRDVGRVVNSTFSDNTALGGTNGLAGNGPFAGDNGRPGKAWGGHLASLDGAVSLKNSILGTNAAGGNVHGSVLDGGHNLVADTTFNIQFNTTRRTNARLEPLANNGGPTPTMAPQTNSPAINAADNAWAPAYDQRGVRRPVGPNPDIGAYERSLAISGRITLGGAGLAYVLINAGEVEVETDSQGNFSAPAGNGPLTITPSLPGYVFSPAFTELANVTSNMTGINFTAVRAFTITGRVAEGTNGLAGIRIFAGTNSIITLANGSFSIPLPAGLYSLYPTSVCYRFTPGATNITAGSATNRFDFQGSPLLAINHSTNRSAVQLTLPCASGMTYRIESSTNLAAWEILSTNPAPINFTIPVTNAGARFFRLRKY